MSEKQFSEEFRKAIEESARSPGEWARKLGVCRSTFHRWVTGRGAPPLWGREPLVAWVKGINASERAFATVTVTLQSAAC